MLLGTLVVSLLTNILIGPGRNRPGYGNKREDHLNKMDF